MMAGLGMKLFIEEGVPHGRIAGSQFYCMCMRLIRRILHYNM